MPNDESAGAPPRAPHRSRARRYLLRLSALIIAAWTCLAGLFLLDWEPLAVPVDGVRAARLTSTFGAPRGGGTRQHEGVDIFARRGTPVRAAGWGVVVAKKTNSLGGKVVYTLGRRGTLCYYAHLDRWADVAVGDLVTEDTVLGYVGNTGNARTTPPHLHFETRPLFLGLRPVDPVAVLGGG